MTNSKRILIVLANPARSTTLGIPVGFWAAELTHAWYEFQEAGYTVTLASPNGGACEMDGWSDPRDPSGYSKHDVLSLGFIHHADLWAATRDTRPIADCRPEDFDALYIAGGQSPMFTFRGHVGLQALIRNFWRAGRIVSAVCHGTAALLDMHGDDGKPFVAGKWMTGFANSEEDAADGFVGTKVMPYRIEDEARAQGALFSAAPAFRAHAVRDGLLITGQQQNSGRAAARLVMEALGQ